jgi:hypothetical protein
MYLYARRIIKYHMSADASKAESSTVITWKKKIPLLTNIFMLKDLATILVISCGLLLVFLLAITGGDMAIIPLWAACSGIVVALVVFSSLAVFFNRMNMEFGIGPEGVLTMVGSKERKMNTAVTIIGILTGNIQATGAGLLARSRETTVASWPEIKKVTVHGNQKVIDLRMGLLTPMRLYCLDENFAAVERMIRENAKNATFVTR